MKSYKEFKSIPSIKVFLPMEEPEELAQSIFLAGPCPRNEKQDDWRDEFISKLKARNFVGDIINPTNRNWDDTDPNFYDKQTAWEQKYMSRASVVVFYINRTEENPAYTTNIEFGSWYKKPESLIVGIPNGSLKCDYIIHECKKRNIPIGESMDDVIDLIIERFSKKPKTFFTSDTHFGQKRTLELSKRPYSNVDEMDNEMISNWNKNITMNDIVYHLGDFGDSKYLTMLNYKELHILDGNYERDSALKIPEGFKDNTIFIHNEPFNIQLSNGDSVLLIHEPIPIAKIKDNKDSFCLYGHAHKAGCKRNGLNVGVDCCNYKPISDDEVIFWKTAIEKHYDDNVFIEKCEI